MNETIAHPSAATPDVVALQQRVVELEQTLLLLGAREARYRHLVESSSDLLACHSPEGDYLYISPACQHLLGYTPDELLGQQPGALVHPDDQAAFQEQQRSARSHPHSMAGTFRYRRKDGTYTWLETSNHAITDPVTGALVEVYTSSRDVSSRKQIQQALNNSETRFRHMAETIQNVFWLLDAATQQLVYISPAYERIWGRTCDSLYAAPESLGEAIHPEDQERIRSYLAQPAQHHGDTECRVLRPDGTLCWVQLHVSQITDADGYMTHVAGVATDITMRKQQETALRASEQRLYQFLEALPAGVFVLNASGQPTYTNQQATEMLGKGIDPLAPLDKLSEVYQAYRKGTDQLYPEDQMPIVRALKGERTTVEDMVVVHPEKGRITLHITAAPITDADGAVIQAIAVFNDITAREQAEAREQEVRDHLHALLDRLDQFVWSLDLRTNTFLYLSPSCERMYGVSMEQMRANPFILRERIHPEDLAIADVAEKALWGGQVVSSEYRIIGANSEIRWVVVDVKPMLDAQGRLVQLDGIATDVTTHKVADLERERMHEDMIRIQQAALQELSTPLIPISDDVVVMPLIGTMDAHRAQQVLETMLQGVEQSRSRVVILDITGVASIDTRVANTLIQAAQAVKLLGAQVVLTGIRPEVAQTLVMLGVDLRMIVTRSSLQDGIAYATDRG
jgi:rsbT co-antagonist protein RsbR